MKRTSLRRFLGSLRLLQLQSDGPAFGPHGCIAGDPEHSAADLPVTGLRSNPRGREEDPTQGVYLIPVVDKLAISGSYLTYDTQITVAVKVDAPEAVYVSQVYVDVETQTAKRYTRN